MPNTLRKKLRRPSRLSETDKIKVPALLKFGSDAIRNSDDPAARLKTAPVKRPDARRFSDHGGVSWPELSGQTQCDADRAVNRFTGYLSFSACNYIIFMICYLS